MANPKCGHAGPHWTMAIGPMDNTWAALNHALPWFGMVVGALYNASDQGLRWVDGHWTRAVILYVTIVVAGANG
jgi:hypothetical protein